MLPFSLGPLPSAPDTFDAQARRNLRLILVGVDRYVHFPENEVGSATNNAIAWLLAAMRMGMQPGGNATALGPDPAVVAEAARDVITAADLSRRERDAARESIDGWLGRGELVKPTFAEIVRILLYVGNDLRFPLTKRLLFVFSGHGALSGGRFVLCPSDAALGAVRRSAAVLQRRLQALRTRMEQAAQAWMARQVRPEATEGVSPELLAASSADLEALAGDTYGWAHAELLDLLSVLVADMEVERPRFRWGALLELVSSLKQNLDSVTGTAPREPAPRATYANVVTPIHLLAALGANARRVTLVLDACHSGGLDTSLQGSQEAHDWTNLGLEARIFSSGHKTQRSAESSFGDRRYAAASWGLTRVLSRWNNVEEVVPGLGNGAPAGKAYAMGISNGNLVMRANLLLDALSLNQRITLSGPPPRDGAPSAADMPFMGFEPTTRTTVDPTADAGGIQLSSGDTAVTIWPIKQGDAVRGAFVAVGSTDWANVTNGVTVATYAANTLYLVGDANTASSLGGQAFTLAMSTAPVSDTFRTTLNNFSNKYLCKVSTWGEEVPYDANTAGSSGYMAFQKDASRPTVWLKWIAPANGDKGKVLFVGAVLQGNSRAYNPDDFGIQNSFAAATPSPGFTSANNWMHLIALGDPISAP